MGKTNTEANFVVQLKTEKVEVRFKEREMVQLKREGKLILEISLEDALQIGTYARLCLPDKEAKLTLA